MLRGFAALLVVVALSACQATGFNGYTSAGPEDVKVVENGGYSERAMAQIALTQNPLFNGGKLPARAPKLVQEMAISCQMQIDEQLAGPVQSTLNGAVPYAIGGAGIGPAAGTAFKGAKASQYATYGIITEFFLGGVNGAITGSYSMAHAKGTCARDFFEDIKRRHPEEFAGTHVQVVLYGKSWAGSTPPALKKDEPRPVSAAPITSEPAPTLRR